jgi:hypothetical protein
LLLAVANLLHPPVLSRIARGHRVWMAGVLRSCRLGIRLHWRLGLILGRNGLVRIRLHRRLTRILSLILRRLTWIDRYRRLGLIRVPGLSGSTGLSGVNRLALTTGLAGVNGMALS